MSVKIGGVEFPAEAEKRFRELGLELGNFDAERCRADGRCYGLCWGPNGIMKGGGLQKTPCEAAQEAENFFTGSVKSRMKESFSGI